MTADRENRLGLGLATEEKRSKNVTGRRMGGLEMRSLAGSPVAPEFIKTSGADHRFRGPSFLPLSFPSHVGWKSQSVVRAWETWKALLVSQENEINREREQIFTLFFSGETLFETLSSLNLFLFRSFSYRSYRGGCSQPKYEIFKKGSTVVFLFGG